jgi:hypothetical protein
MRPYDNLCRPRERGTDDCPVRASRLLTCQVLSVTEGQSTSIPPAGLSSEAFGAEGKLAIDLDVLGRDAFVC